MRPPTPPHEEHAPTPTARPAPRGDAASLCVAGALLALALLMVGVPAAAVALDLARPPLPGAEETGTALGLARRGSVLLLLRSLLPAGGIGLLATALAWPAAWALRGVGPRATGLRSALPGLVAVPLLLPSYLAYAGWGLLRAPGTWLGDALAHGPAWAGTAVNKSLAIGGLSLWAWPLAALILTPAVRRIPESTLESLRLDRAAGRTLRSHLLEHGALLTMTRAGLAAAAGAVTLVMLGSAVPLHLANVDTYSIRVWLVLNESPDPLTAWIASWPLLAVALGAAAWIAAGLGKAGRAGDHGDDEPRPGSVGPRSWPLAATAAVWTLSVLAPLLLFLLNLRERPRPLSPTGILHLSVAFWRVSAGAVGTSLAVAASTGAAGASIAAASWAGASARAGWARRLTLASTALLLAAGLTPGVLVGSAIAHALSDGSMVPEGPARAIADSAAVLVIAHVARFGFVAALTGWWLASLESRTAREARALDGGESLAGWARARLPLHATAVAGAALAVAALSFHEIEATVMLAPPGVQSLPRLILEDLHYARDERLAAAAVSVLSVAVLVGWLAGWLLAHGARRREGRAP